MASILIQSDFDFVDLQGNFKFSERLEPKVIESQRFDLKPLIGDDFYDEVQAVIDNSGTVLGGTSFTQTAYDNLAPYIKNFIKYASFSRYLKGANAVLTRTGVYFKNSPHSERVKDQEKSEMIKYYSGLSVGYGKELYDYLIDNSSDYPEFGSTESDVRATKGIRVTPVSRRERENDLYRIKNREEDTDTQTFL